MTELANHTIFYTIERTIKEYRKFAQRNINKKGLGVTIDQILLMSYLDKYPEMPQNKIAELVFKDNASVTRMIELLVKKKYLKRKVDKNDRRKHLIILTNEGHKFLKELNRTIITNRKTSLKGINLEEINQLSETLIKIIGNVANSNINQKS